MKSTVFRFSSQMRCRTRGAKARPDQGLNPSPERAILFPPRIVLRRLIDSDAGADYRSIQARLPRSKPDVHREVLVSFVKSLDALSMAAERLGPPGQNSFLRARTVAIMRRIAGTIRLRP